MQTSDLGSVEDAYQNPTATRDRTTRNRPSAMSDKMISGELKRLLGGAGGSAGYVGSDLDSSQADRLALRQFYQENNYKPVWLTGSGYGFRGGEIISELRGADQYGLDPRDFSVARLTFNAPGLARAELTLSTALLRYAAHAKGWRVDPRLLSANIDRGPPAYDRKRLLQAVSTSNAPALYMRRLHPKHPQFEALRRQYVIAQSQAGRRRDAQLILVNMERWRWMPKKLGAYYIQVNIPEFRMRVINRGQILHEAKIVVGKLSNQTPVFSDKIEYLAFHPYWNVPRSIKLAEILPRLRRGEDVMRKENLRVRVNGKDVNPYLVDWRRANPAKYDFYQAPGQKNVLGFVKFMFPNKHSVYLHDTSSRRLFSRDVRLYSHGCIRVENPARLAEILLNHDKGWGRSQVAGLIANQTNTRIDLTKTIPVHITYFTAWVDGAGRLNLRDDYYGHDRLIIGHLTGKQNLIPAPRLKLAAKKNRRETRRVVRRRNNQPTISNWLESIFDFN